MSTGTEKHEYSVVLATQSHKAQTDKYVAQ